MRFTLASNIDDVAFASITMGPESSFSKMPGSFHSDVHRALFGTSSLPGCRLRLTKLPSSSPADYACTIRKTVEGVTWAFRVTEDQLYPGRKARNDDRVLQIRASNLHGRTKLWAVVLKDNQTRAEIYGFNEGKWNQRPIFGSMFSEADEISTKDAFCVAYAQIVMLLDLF